MRVARTILGGFGRVPVATAALLQGVCFIALTLASASLIGAGAGWLVGARAKGARIGLGGGALFVVAGFGSAVDEVCAPAAFLEWFFHSVVLPQLAIALATLSYYLIHAFGVHPAYSVLLALTLGLPASSAGLKHLFPFPEQFQTVVAEPLSPFTEAVWRANLFARTTHGPGAARRARQGAGHWEEFYARLDEMRRRFRGQR
jgi:hypothetical protein